MSKIEEITTQTYWPTEYEEHVEQLLSAIKEQGVSISISIGEGRQI